MSKALIYSKHSDVTSRKNHIYIYICVCVTKKKNDIQHHIHVESHPPNVKHPSCMVGHTYVC